MDKRTLLAVVLSIAIIIVFSYLFPPQMPVQPPTEPQQTEKKVEKEKLPVSAAETSYSQAEIPPAEEKEIKVDTDLYSAVLTTKGGTLKEWYLKEYNYKDKDEDDKLKPVPLISPDAPIPPISIILNGQPEDSLEKIYSVDKDTVILNSFRKSDTLTFFYTDASGISIKKSFTFYKDSYRVDLFTEVKGVQSYKVALGSGFVDIFDEKGTWVHMGPVLLRDSEKIDIDKKISKG